MEHSTAYDDVNDLTICQHRDLCYMHFCDYEQMCDFTQKAHMNFCAHLRKSLNETLEMLQQAYSHGAMSWVRCFAWHSRGAEVRASHCS